MRSSIGKCLRYKKTINHNDFFDIQSKEAIILSEYRLILCASFITWANVFKSEVIILDNKIEDDLTYIRNHFICSTQTTILQPLIFEFQPQMKFRVRKTKNPLGEVTVSSQPTRGSKLKFIKNSKIISATSPIFNSSNTASSNYKSVVENTYSSTLSNQADSSYTLPNKAEIQINNPANIELNMLADNLNALSQLLPPFLNNIDQYIGSPEACLFLILNKEILPFLENLRIQLLTKPDDKQSEDNVNNRLMINDKIYTM